MKKEDLKKYLMLETPVVVYNLDDLNERLCTLNNILPDWINVIYSVKANSNKKILDLFSKNKLIKGFEVSSYQELHKIEKFSEKKIFVIGPSFTDDQIKELFKNGYVYDFNNIEQVYRLQNFLKDKKIGLRIQLEKSELEYKNNNLISRFGVDIKSSKWDEFSEFLRNFNIKITRVHIHNGEKDVNELRKIVSTINTIMEKNVLSNDVDINIGGGWEHIFKNMLLDQTISELEKINGIRSIYIEPGKALIDSIGYLIASVINKYYDVNHLNLILNASAHNLITWFPTYPIASSKSNNNNILTNIWGNTCYEEDFFVKRIAINELDINDKIIFHPFGAYYKNNSKNLHDINFPREVYFQNGVFT